MSFGQVRTYIYEVLRHWVISGVGGVLTILGVVQLAIPDLRSPSGPWLLGAGFASLCIAQYRAWAEKPSPVKLVIDCGSDSSFNFLDFRDITRSPLSADPRDWFTTVVEVRNTAPREASRVRVRLTNMERGHPGQEIPCPLYWWPDAVEERDLGPFEKGKVVLHRVCRVTDVKEDPDRSWAKAGGSARRARP
jgi:hypothetical protein